MLNGPSWVAFLSLSACFVTVSASAQNLDSQTQGPKGDRASSHDQTGKEHQDEKAESSATVLRSPDEGENPVASDRPPLTYHVASPPQPSEEQRDVRLIPPPTDSVATTDLVENPFGTKRSTFFAGATGTGVTQNSSNAAQGGVILGGAPINRLTLHGYIGRDENGRLAPSATVHVRFLGDYASGYALGGLVRYKTEGFTEAGGEAEIGLTGGFHRAGLHLDANFVGGLGVEESEMGEMDAEGRLRLGYDVIRFIRLGAVGQVRTRLAGDRSLAGGHKWDAMGGPAISAWYDRFLLCLNGGPSTVGVASGLGAYGMVTIAAVSDL